MTAKPNEALSVVENINGDLSEVFKDVLERKDQATFSYTDEDFVYGFWLEFVSSGNTEAINFMGHAVYCSENDDRPYLRGDDGKEEREPLETYVRRQMRRIVFFANWLAGF